MRLPHAPFGRTRGSIIKMRVPREVVMILSRDGFKILEKRFVSEPICFDCTLGSILKPVPPKIRIPSRKGRLFHGGRARKQSRPISSCIPPVSEVHQHATENLCPIHCKSTEMNIIEDAFSPPETLGTTEAERRPCHHAPAPSATCAASTQRRCLPYRLLHKRK